MKKRMIALLVSLLCLCGTAVGCAGKENEKMHEGSVLYGFESYNEIVSITNLHWRGSLDLNSDEAYITEGEHSLKWYAEAPNTTSAIIVSQGTYASPLLNIAAGNFYKDISPFADVSAYSLDVFNANDFAVNVALWAESGATAVAVAHAEIQPGAKRTIELTVNSFAVDGVSNLSGLCIALYDPVFGRPSTLYIDNLCVFTERAPVSEITLQQTGTLVGLDSLDMLDYVTALNKTELPMVAVDYNVDQKFTNGRNGSILIDLVPYSDGVHLLSSEKYGRGQRAGMRILSSLVKQINFSLVEFIENGKISVDVYNDYTSDEYAYLELTDETGNTVTVAQKLKAKEWTTIAMTDFGNVDLSRIAYVDVLFDMYYLGESKQFYCNNLYMGE